MMVQKYATSVEQSNRLLAAGADPRTADLAIDNYHEHGYSDPHPVFGDVPLTDDLIPDVAFPSWSIHGLMGLLADAKWGSLRIERSIRYVVEFTWYDTDLWYHEITDAGDSPIDAIAGVVVKYLEWNNKANQTKEGGKG